MFLLKGMAVFFLRIYAGILGIIYFFHNNILRVVKIKKRFELLTKIKNIIIKVLNLGASGYGLFTSLEPMLARFSNNEE